ncbi:MAG: hypothetical protein JWR88_1164 [Pseudonocardia sp.]|nr:hypothetical protein [Pseudonocardia sp.]
MSGGAPGLTTRGRCLMAAGIATAVCSVLLNERDLLRVGVLVTALPLLAMLMTRMSRVAVRAERVIDPPRVPVGSTAEVRVTVSSRSPWAAGGMFLEDGAADAAGPPGGAPPRFTLLRMPRRHPVELVYPLQPTLRGRHRVGPLNARLTDPFGLAEQDRELAPASVLTVVPRVVGLQHVVPGGGGWAVAGAAGATTNRYGHGEVDVGVRPYRHGDELRRVHWRSTAHRDELMVRLEERPQRSGITVLLDRRDFAHLGIGPDSSLEWAVSMVASVCVHLIDRGEPVVLVTEDGARIGADGGAEGLLDALAGTRTSMRSDFNGPALHQRLNDSGTDGVLAVLGALGTADLRQLQRLRDPAPRGGAHAVLLATATWSGAALVGDSGGAGRRGAGRRDAAGGRDVTDVADSAGSLRAAGWAAIVATAATPQDQAWHALVNAEGMWP